jgi:uncharacterized membrane protein
MHEELLREAVQWVTRAIEILGILIILIGILVALVRFAARLDKPEEGQDRISCMRSNLGRSILLGLEFLVAADIINTVAIEPTLDSVVVLAGIVLIRTFLSWSLEVEIEGRWPWQRAAAERAGREP